MLPARIKNNTPIDDFPAEFTRYVRWWSYNEHYAGIPPDERPSKMDHELYADHVGVKSHIVYNLMQYPTESIPAEILEDLGIAVSTELVLVEVKERRSCVVKCDYKA